MTDTRETAARVAVEIADLVGFDPTVQNAAGQRVEDIVDEALRKERERALVDAGRLECVFCAGAEGFNASPVAENGTYVHRNPPPKGLAGVLCRAQRIRALAAAIRNPQGE